MRNFAIKQCALRRVRASTSLKPLGDVAGQTRRVSSRLLAARPAKSRPLSTLRLGRGNAKSTLLASQALSRGGSTRCSPRSSVVSGYPTPRSSHLLLLGYFLKSAVQYCRRVATSRLNTNPYEHVLCGAGELASFRRDEKRWPSPSPHRTNRPRDCRLPRSLGKEPTHGTDPRLELVGVGGARCCRDPLRHRRLDLPARRHSGVCPALRRVRRRRRHLQPRRGVSRRAPGRALALARFRRLGEFDLRRAGVLLAGPDGARVRAADRGVFGGHRRRRVRRRHRAAQADRARVAARPARRALHRLRHPPRHRARSGVGGDRDLDWSVRARLRSAPRRSWAQAALVGEATRAARPGNSTARLKETQPWRKEMSITPAFAISATEGPPPCALPSRKMASGGRSTSARRTTRGG